MNKLQIIKPGLLTTVQDSGRLGYQQYGVPVSGVMDHFSYRMANWLVGNDDSRAVLEITLMGPEIRVDHDTVIAVAGGDLGAALDGEPIPLWTAIMVKTGQKITFKSIKNGCRAYLAVAGGIEVPEVMGSKSTYTRGQIGGYQGRALKSGDDLEVGTPRLPLEQVANQKIDQNLYDYTSIKEIRVVSGPQEEAFTEDGLDTFYQSSYSITNECDRMGYRLKGNEVGTKESSDIISDGITMGAIQVPGHGMPIVMMADRQTTGGYTKIANVISIDLPKMGQLKPGDKICFKKVTIEEAQRLLIEQEKVMENYKKQLGINTDQVGTFTNPPPDKPEVEILSRKELFRYKKGGKQYCITIEEIKDVKDLS